MPPDYEQLDDAEPSRTFSARNASSPGAINSHFPPCSPSVHRGRSGAVPSPPSANPALIGAGPSSPRPSPPPPSPAPTNWSRSSSARAQSRAARAASRSATIAADSASTSSPPPAREGQAESAAQDGDGRGQPRRRLVVATVGGPIGPAHQLEQAGQGAAGVEIVVHPIAEAGDGIGIEVARRSAPLDHGPSARGSTGWYWRAISSRRLNPASASATVSGVTSIGDR